MRALIAREKGDRGDFDLKLAPGGLIDVEFLAQYLILANAAARPELMRPETRAALAEAARVGLLSLDDGAALAQWAVRIAHLLQGSSHRFPRLARGVKSVLRGTARLKRLVRPPRAA